eukprot:jgi/Tetstr1/442337/TSEL_030477.t1
MALDTRIGTLQALWRGRRARRAVIGDVRAEYEAALARLEGDGVAVPSGKCHGFVLACPVLAAHRLGACEWARPVSSVAWPGGKHLCRPRVEVSPQVRACSGAREHSPPRSTQPASSSVAKCCERQPGGGSDTWAAECRPVAGACAAEGEGGVDSTTRVGASALVSRERRQAAQSSIIERQRQLEGELWWALQAIQSRKQYLRSLDPHTPGTGAEL